MKHPYSDFIHQIQQPARYMGGEYNSRTPDLQTARVSMVLAFPDVYDIGMSHLGTKILYKILGEHPEIAVERAFCPWFDLEEALRERSLPLVTLETAKALSDFDVVGFSLQYEMTFTNVLTMLDLGGIPLRAADRGEDAPLVIGGGPTATHPEPVAPFFDAFLVGDAEERLPELLLRWAELRDAGVPRQERLIELAKLGGIYCPSLYVKETEERYGFLIPTDPLHEGVPARVERAFVEDINRYPFPDDSPVAVAEAIFDRMSIEIARGCTEGCRFCQAGMIYRPVRERSPDEIVNTVMSSIEKGGYDEVSLTSLSTADYSCISPLIKKVMAKLREKKVSLGVSSLRAYGLDEDLLDEIADVRATGLTFAPEAGTQRMRDVVNKNIDEQDILTTAERVFSRGWQRMKLYFMIGLPTEKEEDVVGIAELGRACLEIGKQYQKGKAKVTVSVSSHVPKPHTPFQWASMDDMDSIGDKQRLLGDLCRNYRLQFRRHDMRVSHLEGIIARGDSRVADLLEDVWRQGARFDGWDEHLKWDIWSQALEKWEARTGISRWMFLGTIPMDARLPWDHIDVGLEDGFLAREWKRASKDRLSPPCGKPYQAKVHHTNLQDAQADERKLICYHCGVACDLAGMRQERMDFLQILGATEPPAERTTSNRQQALQRIAKGQAPRNLNQGERIRYRLAHTKLGKNTLQGHLDTVREMPRVFRRAGFDLFYSQGFHPMPSMSFGSAPKLGMQSVHEVLEVDLTHEVAPAEMLRRLNQSSPEGMLFLECRRVGPQDRALSKILNGIEAVVLLSQEQIAALGGKDALQLRLESAMAQEVLEAELVRKKGTRIINVRSSLEKVELWSLDEIRQALPQLLQKVEPDSSLPRVELQDVQLGIWIRRLQPEGPQPRMTELVQALTGWEPTPEEVIRLAVLANLPNGTRGNPLDAIQGTEKAAYAQPAKSTSHQATPELLQIT